jgi:hypothetical protein
VLDEPVLFTLSPQGKRWVRHRDAGPNALRRWEEDEPSLVASAPASRVTSAVPAAPRGLMREADLDEFRKLGVTVLEYFETSAALRRWDLSLR